MLWDRRLGLQSEDMSLFGVIPWRLSQWLILTGFCQTFPRAFQFSIFRSALPLATRSACRLFERQRVLRTGRKNLQFIKVPSTLCSDASFASFQRLLLYSARHQHASCKASRLTAAGIPDSLPHTSQGGTLRVAALQSIMKPYFTPHLYLYFFGIYCYWENNCNTATLRGTAHAQDSCPSVRIQSLPFRS
jgi:hypothetical protein